MLALPDVAENPDPDSKCYEFFSANGKPIIPGSEIRGCIRSAFEAVTKSCYSVINDGVLSKRKDNPDNSRKPGILKREKTGCVLYKAEYRDQKKRYPETIKRAGIIIEHDYHRKWFRCSDIPAVDDKVYFYPESVKFKLQNNSERQINTTFLAKISMIEFAPNGCKKSYMIKCLKHLISCGFQTFLYNQVSRIQVYLKKKNNKPIASGADCRDENIDDLLTIFDIYYDNLEKTENREEQTEETAGAIKALKGIIRNYQKDIREMKIDTMVPVFYQKSENGSELLYLSPAHTGRFLFKKTLPKLLGDHDSCKAKDGKYCPACSLFGTLGDKSPLASRLRFSDAEEKDGTVNISSDFVILPELSSPKLSTIEFYSLKGTPTKNASMWDYDTEGAELRGRKFYFHSLPKYENKPLEEMNGRQTATKPALAGSLFTFKIYFDEIKREELQQLLWVLTIGENSPESKQMHKLGTGKPVGYGSIKITVDSISLRKFDREEFAYKVDEKSYDGYMQDFELPKYFDSNALQDFKNITNYHLLISDVEKEEKVPVSYPIGEREEDSNNSDAGHQWFSGNRSSENTFGSVLPVLSNDINSLRMLALHGKKKN